MRTIALALALLWVCTKAHAGGYENATAQTPMQRMPPGTYRCSMGSYAAKPCEVTVRNGRSFLTVTAGARFSFELELYGTDEADQLIGQGRLLAAGELCPDCPVAELGSTCAGDAEEKRTCPQQPVTIDLRKGKNGVWSGKLLAYLVRGSYDQAGALRGWHRLGLSEVLRIAPSKG